MAVQLAQPTGNQGTLNMASSSQKYVRVFFFSPPPRSYSVLISWNPAFYKLNEALGLKLGKRRRDNIADLTY